MSPYSEHLFFRAVANFGKVLVLVEFYIQYWIEFNIIYQILLFY